MSSQGAVQERIVNHPPFCDQLIIPKSEIINIAMYSLITGLLMCAALVILMFEYFEKKSISLMGLFLLIGLSKRVG